MDGLHSPFVLVSKHVTRFRMIEFEGVVEEKFCCENIWNFERAYTRRLKV